MSNDMSDDRFDDWVQKAAQSYNRPPDIAPRDAMWESIEGRGQRGEARGESRFQGPESRVSAVLRSRPWMLAAAAMLLLAAGIGIGRMTMNGGMAQLSSSPESGVQSPEKSATTASAESVGLPTPSTPASQRLTATEPRTTGYDLVAAQHLGSVEALLTSFRLASDSSMDTSMRRWARDLLSTTRLLLDSPAGGDAQLRQLLEDLELVLVQMVQLPSKVEPMDRELIKRAIARQQVLTRIRTSIPAGTPSGT